MFSMFVLSKLPLVNMFRNGPELVPVPRPAHTCPAARGLASPVSSPERDHDGLTSSSQAAREAATGAKGGGAGGREERRQEWGEDLEVAESWEAGSTEVWPSLCTFAKRGSSVLGQSSELKKRKKKNPVF